MLSNRVHSLVLDHNGHQSVLCWIQTHTRSHQCATSSYSTSGNQFCTRVPPSAGDSPSSKNMVACKGESVPGTFQRRCGDTMMLSEGRRATSAPCDYPAFSPPHTAFSNAPILKGQVFSVKVRRSAKGM